MGAIWLAGNSSSGADSGVDAKTDEDITHNVLTQIIMDEETRGETLLPVNFLRHLIGMYGDKMQSMVPQYLEASMDAFRKNQQQFQEAMKGAFGGGPLAEIAKRNMQMFEAAASAFGNGVPGMPGATPSPTPAATEESKDDEIAVLKAQLAAWDKVTEKKASENPLFAKVLESQRTFAKRAAAWQNDTTVNFRMAYDHFFSKKG